MAEECLLGTFEHQLAIKTVISQALSKYSNRVNKLTHILFSEEHVPFLGLLDATRLSFRRRSPSTVIVTTN